MSKRQHAFSAVVVAAALALSACGPKPAEGEAGKAEAQATPQYDQINAKHGDAARGEKLSVSKDIANKQSCVDCHGAAGAKPIDPTYPVLAGQYQDYLFHALKAYRDGGRDHALMSGHMRAATAAKTLDDQGIADLAAYFAAQPSPLADLNGQ
jgi:cytochrome c553